MSNLVLDRINQQIQERQTIRPSMILSAPVKEPKSHEDEPISPEVLKTILMENLNPNPDTQTNGHKEFTNIEQFVEWYLPLQSKFTEMQRIALASVVQARDMIFQGCNCKMRYRQEQSNNYFKTFWINNAKTDLPEAVLKIGNFSSLTFIWDARVYFTYPPPVLPATP